VFCLYIYEMGLMDFSFSTVLIKRISQLIMNKFI